MMRLIRIFAFGLLLILIFQNCSKNQDEITDLNKSKYIEALRQTLINSDKMELENPFIQRKVEPYLDGKWIGNGVSYGGYRRGQAPGVKGPSKIEILEDLKIIKKYWNLIRIYGADADAENILSVIRENNLPIKVMLGVWLENETDNPELKKRNVEQTIFGVYLANKFPELIYGVNVGNESQVFWSGHKMDMNDLIKYIRFVRNNTKVPITTADDYNFWNKPESVKIEKEIDFIVLHAYPLWNGLKLDNAIAWMDSIYFQVAKKMHPSKEIVFGETGWATKYDAGKIGPGEQGTLIKAEVSLNAQEKYLRLHNEWVEKNKVTTFLFEAFDEPWKGGGDKTPSIEIEKNWGVFYEDRTPKESFSRYINTK